MTKISQSNGFQFKQFFVAHDKCAMKVNTDGIILGALVDCQAERILDLGTGTGLVALILAQRNSKSQITALELEPNAYQQAVENVQHSAWAQRINVVQGDVLKANFSSQFDLIVSNPPYFADSLASRNAERDLARAAVQSHLDWLLQAKKWLAPQGKITFILPTEAAEKLLNESQTSGLFCSEICKIITKTGLAPKRWVMTFDFLSQEKKEKTLAVYDEHNQYTTEFTALTQAFYLKM